MSAKTIYLASDHRGLAYKKVFIEWLGQHGYEAVDLGPETATRCNAGDYALKLVRAMKADPDSKGVLICMTGQAMTMTANRFQHIRAALCVNTTMARLARQHNDANVMTLGSYIVGESVALDCLESFLATEPFGGAYAERCQVLTDLGGL